MPTFCKVSVEPDTRCGGQRPPDEKSPQSFSPFRLFPFFPQRNHPGQGPAAPALALRSAEVSATKFFSTGAALQDYLLEHAGPGVLGLIPHQRLAHQVWHRQRLAALAAGRPAWEPLALLTLNAWWSELFKGLWSPVALAPALVRLALWRQALKTAPPPPGPTPELAWAQALDEAHTLLCRYAMAAGDARPTAARMTQCWWPGAAGSPASISSSCGPEAG